MDKTAKGISHGRHGLPRTDRKEADHRRRWDSKLSLKYGATTDQIIGAGYAVHDHLGFGFLEKVYENAMDVELRKRGLKVVQQFPMKVWYHDTVVGEYACDLLVGDKVLVELKSVKDLAELHHAQIINYLRAVRLEVGLLINFGPKLEVKRKILDVDRPDQANKT